MHQWVDAARLHLGAAVAAAVLAWGGPAAATVLVFDQNGGGQPLQPGDVGGPVPAGYGSRVSAAFVPVPGGGFTYGNEGEGFTPNVAVELFAAGATASDSRMRLWQQGYGDLVNVMFGEGPGTTGASELFVRLEADPGYIVDLYGLDLAGFGGRDYTITGVEVLAGLVPLFAVQDLLVEGGAGHTHLDFGGVLSGSGLLIRVDLTGLAPGIRDNIGLDSIRFGQTPPPLAAVLPEPSALALLAMGMLMLAWRGPARTSRQPGRCCADAAAGLPAGPLATGTPCAGRSPRRS